MRFSSRSRPLVDDLGGDETCMLVLLGQYWVLACQVKSGRPGATIARGDKNRVIGSRLSCKTYDNVYVVSMV